MTSPVCPNYGNCIPGIACSGEPGCLIFRLDQTVGSILETQTIHTRLHETQNGDLREIVDWVRWAKRTASGMRTLAGILMSLGIIGAAIEIARRFLGG